MHFVRQPHPRPLKQFFTGYTNSTLTNTTKSYPQFSNSYPHSYTQGYPQFSNSYPHSYTQGYPQVYQL